MTSSFFSESDKHLPFVVKCKSLIITGESVLCKKVKTRCLKITEKVAFNIASEASYSLHFEWTKID